MIILLNEENEKKPLRNININISLNIVYVKRFLAEEKTFVVSGKPVSASAKNDTQCQTYLIKISLKIR